MILLPVPVKNLHYLFIKQEKVPDVSGQQPECENIIDRPLPVHDNIPESTHPMDFVLHGPADQAMIDEMHQDILVIAANSKSEIRVDDGADIKNILNGKFDSLVDPVF